MARLVYPPLESHYFILLRTDLNEFLPHYSIFSYSLIVLSYDTCLIKFKIERVFVFFFEIKLIEQIFCRIFILKYP